MDTPDTKSLVPVAFDGDVIETLPDGERVWVGVRGVSESFGIDASTQIAKLKGHAWATVGLRPMVAEDGKIREVFCLDLDSFPMWLATIDAGRVADEARPKLIRYQREAARVLRDHFFGPPVPVGSAPPLLPGLLLDGARFHRAAADALEAGDVDTARRCMGAAYMLTRAPRQGRQSRVPYVRDTGSPVPTERYVEVITTRVLAALRKGPVPSMRALRARVMGKSEVITAVVNALVQQGAVVEENAGPYRPRKLSLAPTAPATEVLQ